MPHIVMECSGNLRSRADLTGLVERVHAAALATGVFPEGGLRTRLTELSEYRIADGDAANAFVHITVRVGHGRDLQTRRRAGTAIFEAMAQYLEPAFTATPLALSLEVQEIDPELSFKKNNLHEYVKQRRSVTC